MSDTMLPRLLTYPNGWLRNHERTTLGRLAYAAGVDMLDSRGVQSVRYFADGIISMQLQPSASYSITLRIETSGLPGTLGRVTSAIGETGGVVGAIDLVSVGSGATCATSPCPPATTTTSNSLSTASQAWTG